MMDSIILRTPTRALAPLMLIFSVFLLVRGHNEPGGGFVGGLVAATAFALVLASDGLAKARSLLRLEPLSFVAVGLGVAVSSGVTPLFEDGAFLTGLWLKTRIPVIGKLGTPFVFDVGVYLVVLGITLTIIFELAEERP